MKDTLQYVMQTSLSFELKVLYGGKYVIVI